jgi:U3 small nucleolar RNA-associated protein 25
MLLLRWNLFSSSQYNIYSKNRDEIHNLASLHVLNHVLTSRTRVQRHNRRIRELASARDGGGGGGGGDDDDVDRWRDQGYARPKVLVLLPTRGACRVFVESMVRLLGASAIVDNMDRFRAEYGPAGGGGADGGGADGGGRDGGAAGGDLAGARRAAVLRQKGPEWNELFGDDADDDDDFKTGLSLTPNYVGPPPPSSSSSGGGKKEKRAGRVGGGASGGGGASSSGVNVKLCAEFYRSDIILASPIGLKMAISGKDGDNDDDDDGGGDDDADVDFLSSIDVCLVVRSDVLHMQNWDHVNTVLDSLNRQPRNVADVDFSRVRNYHLEGRGSDWRQLILVSQFACPRVLSTFRRHAKSVGGSLRMRRVVLPEDASVCDVAVRGGARQVFQRVACRVPSEAGSDRLRYFSEHVLPKLTRSGQKHTLVYVPSYFDFISLRNLLLKREADFVSVTEYARVSEVSRGRARFLQGRKSIMLYTGRAHFFLRHRIKGARHVIFFGLPEYAEFYPAVVNMLNGGSPPGDAGEGVISSMPMSCLSLFTKFDAHQLEGIVGTSNAERLIRPGEKSSFMFSS